MLAKCSRYNCIEVTEQNEKGAVQVKGERLRPNWWNFMRRGRTCQRIETSFLRGLRERGTRLHSNESIFSFWHCNVWFSKFYIQILMIPISIRIFKSYSKAVMPSCHLLCSIWFCWCQPSCSFDWQVTRSHVRVENAIVLGHRTISNGCYCLINTNFSWKNSLFACDNTNWRL